MDGNVSPLVRELLAWVARRPRTYEEAMEAWRSTCPRHTTWEDALIDGLVDVSDGRVELTAAGKALLDHIVGGQERGDDYQPSELDGQPAGIPFDRAGSVRR